MSTVTAHLTRHASSESVKRRWFVIDAKDRVLGDVASQAAHILRGKHKTIYTDHVDDADHVVIVNASHVKVTGNKRIEKKYYTHSNWPGGIHETNFDQLITKHPERVLEYAVGGMIKKHRLGRAQLRHLKVYAGDKHPHPGAEPAPAL